MIELTDGDLLRAPAEALVNTVNTEGIMGKGIALQFKQAYPQMYAAYLSACKAGDVKIGHMQVNDLGAIVGGPRWIINFPTKRHWKSKSKLEDIRLGLVDLVRTLERLNIHSVAVPPLGCGNGGLDWADVYPLIHDALCELRDVHVFLYSPSGAPAPRDMTTRTKSPEMTTGRACLIGLMHRYQRALLDPVVSLMEIHKLMYFLQEAGQPLRLTYASGKFGPYASNLRQVLIRLEGHWLSGYGDGEDAPTKPLELIGDAAEQAEQYLSSYSEVVSHMDRVSALIEGYEDPYGMELLSSTHWVMCRDAVARDSANDAVRLVHDWNARKRKLFKPAHIQLAWDRLRSLHWHSESRSAVH